MSGWLAKNGATGERGGQRLLLSLLLAAAIPLLLFGGLVVYDTAVQERALARQTAADIAKTVAQRVTAELFTQIQVATALAVSVTLDEPDLAAFKTEAERLKTNRPLWHTIQLADANGAQILNLLHPPDTPLGSDTDQVSFQRMMTTRLPMIGGIGQVGAGPGERLVALRVPVVRFDEVRFILSIALAPDAITSILRSAGAPEGWIGTVVDADGDIIARTAKDDNERGRRAGEAVRGAIARAPQGFYSERTLEGIDVETVYRTLPDTGGWSVHFSIPKEMLHGPVNRSTYFMVGGGLASLVLAGGLAYLAARDIAQRRREENNRSAITLKLSEERGAVAVEAADLGTWSWDLAKGQLTASRRCSALLGLPTTDPDRNWMVRELWARVHPDDRSSLVATIRHWWREDVTTSVEFRVVQTDGSLHWLQATGRGQQIRPDQPRLIHGVIADIEPAKRAETERFGLLRRLTQAQEDERRRIARELHDQVGQTVTGLSLGLKSLEQALPQDQIGPDLQGRLTWLRSLTTEIGREIHRAASDLRPTALDDLGLGKALLAYVYDWGARYGIRVDAQSIGQHERLPAEIETAVYRIVQEALTNVVKHASARHVSVVLEQSQSQLRVVVEDDGQGFLVDRHKEDGHSFGERRRLGISGIRERLAQIGGTMALESTPDIGTTLFIRIPIQPRLGLSIA